MITWLHLFYVCKTKLGQSLICKKFHNQNFATYLGGGSSCYSLYHLAPMGQVRRTIQFDGIMVFRVVSQSVLLYICITRSEGIKAWLLMWFYLPFFVMGHQYSRFAFTIDCNDGIVEQARNLNYYCNCEIMVE